MFVCLSLVGGLIFVTSIARVAIPPLKIITCQSKVDAVISLDGMNELE